jgi:hypothetical protein
MVLEKWEGAVGGLGEVALVKLAVWFVYNLGEGETRMRE